MSQEFDIREAMGSDLPFIFDTFLKSYKMSSSIGKSCRNGIFFDNYRRILDLILEQSKVRVACHKESPEVIFGYIISDGPILHYVFVKQSFRKLGIATSLYQEALQDADSSLGFICTSHKTSFSDEININVPYNPFVLYQTN